ncbi:glutamate 5-kinase [Sphingomonas jaspsi]|uniref:glutamate 5-kinase n=1 Tax=Sphingomonas jaspsi TaxID=392409 RepID=UPI0004B1AA9D|nr:glutamate 5-kinase [Sphingomonas jaspsi]
MANTNPVLPDIDAAAPAALLSAARRVTIKVGSSLIVDASSDGVRRDWLATLAADISDLRRAGKQVVAVSSGAVALGRRRLDLKKSARLSHKQAAAAAGQPLLMQAWEQALAPYSIATAQLLLTIDDTESRRRWLNGRATMEVLLGSGVLPVINENDSVATEELRYGDNDRLSARAAQMVQCDLLMLLSDVDGLYTANPMHDPDASHVPHIAAITDDIERYAGDADGDGVGSGGMRTKLAAARIAQGFGCATIIASGRSDHPLRSIAHNKVRATVVDAAGTPARAYKQWIAGTLVPAGALTVDDGAVAALRGGSSLLPAGVRGVDGRFERGVCLRVLDPAGREVARGITAYDSVETASILGCASADIGTRLGYNGPDEVIHRDDMVLL